MSGRIHAVLAIVVALGLHIGIFALKPEPAGAIAAGADGLDLVSLQAADASVSEMVDDWNKPPETAAEPEMPTTMPQAFDPPPKPSPLRDAPPALPSPTPPMALPQMAEMLPQADTSLPPPPPPEPEPEPEPITEPMPTTRPEPRPKVTKAPAPPKPKQAAKKTPTKSAPSAARAAQKAAGSGNGAQAGTGGAAAAATLSKAKLNDLRASWGASIRSRVERRKAYPSAARGASGTVTVRLSVNRSGQLVGVSVVKSSGNAALDQAAVKAVQANRKFPAAPKGLTESSYTFNLPMRFSR